MSETNNGELTPRRTLRERLLALISFRSGASEADLSDADLRNALERVLRATEPGFLGVDSVYPSDTQVVYAVAPEDTLILYRRSYSVAADGAVTLADDKEQVRPITRYEPVTAQSATASGTPEPAAAEAPPNCGCDGNRTAEEGAKMNKQERVKALIACPKTPFTDADAAMLEGLSDERLDAYEAHFNKVEVGETKAKAEPTPAKTEEQFLAEAPEPIRAIVAEHKAAQAAKKTALVATLMGAQDVYTEAELQALDTATLEKLAKIAKPATATDFSGRGVPRHAEDEVVPAAPSLVDRIKARK